MTITRPSPTSVAPSTRPVEELMGRVRPARAGAAMATALFTMTAAAILTAAIHYMTQVDLRMTTNRESSLRSLAIAEAGATHALAIMRDVLPEVSYTGFLQGPDTTAYNVADDGYLIGRTLTSGATGNDIPVAGREFGGGRYTVRVVDDPADTDGDSKRDQNSRITVECTGYGPEGSKVVLNVLVGGITMPGFIVDGDIALPGTVRAIGRCGGMHANGSINVSGQLRVTGPVSTTASASGSIVNDVTSGAVTPVTIPTVADMPDMNPDRLCRDATYHMKANGDVLLGYNGTLIGNAYGTTVSGWKQHKTGSDGEWKPEVDSPPTGSYCFEGNVLVGKQMGTRETPLPISIYATKSVQISGNPYMVSYDSDSIVIASGGDVELNGNPESGGVSYGGAVYAKNQCKVPGNAVFTGQLLCDNDLPQTPGALGLADNNEFSGSPTITYNCNNKYASTRRMVGWTQVPGPQ